MHGWEEFLLSTIFIGIFSFLLRSLSGTNKILTFGISKNNILKFIRPKPSSFFNFSNLKGIRLTTQFHLELSHLREHKFKYNFQYCLNSLSSCGSSSASTSHFLLHCPIFKWSQNSFLSNLMNINYKIS